METVYKLTDQHNRTRVGYSNETLWGESVTHTAPGGGELCSDKWLHAYADPILAVLMNPAHANFRPDAMKLWEASAEVGLRKADKLGCTRITTLHTISIPTITKLQKQAFAILAAKDVYKNKDWNAWADAWLSGEDRTESSARQARREAYAADAAAAAYAAYAADAADAAYAAYAAAAAVRSQTSLNLVALAHKVVREF